MKALLTRKLGMATALNDKGAATAVTLLSAEPNVITQLKTTDRDSYEAVQIGAITAKKIAKAQTGHLKNAKKTVKFMREIKIDAKSEQAMNVGDEISADIFDVGELVDATAVNKGKGFAGTIKRHNFHRGRKTHGGRSYRRPGSIGSMYPQRIFPGKKMAGRMGGVKTTTKNLRVALINVDMQIIAVEGSVPGPKKGLVLLKGVK
jgi:large subunit ribosomal protein L3